MTASKPHVFLSHVREDSELVQRLAKALEARGIATWIDREKIRPGVRWERAIEQAIRDGALFVACFSKAYAARPDTYMNEELHVAAKQVRRKALDVTWFIPLKLDDGEIPDWPFAPELGVRSFQWVDVWADWEKGVDDLAQAAGRMPDRLLQDFAVFRDVDAPWCPEMVVIPAGRFLMGSPENEKGRDRSEGPQHEVRITRRFAIGRFPLTSGEYAHFLDATFRDSDPHPSGRWPVEVWWEDAARYVEWLGKETGKSYRLPSEAEWEYACRAGTTTRYHWGDVEPTRKLAVVSYVKSTRPPSFVDVGSCPPNPWGLYDMHGLVREWVEDWWHDSYKGAPSDGSAWTGGDEVCRVQRFYRLQRGSSLLDDSPRCLRSAYRNLAVNHRGQTIKGGWRIARTLET